MTFVVPVPARVAEVGATILVERRPAVVVHVLPAVPGRGRGRAARVTQHPDCGRCEAPLDFDPGGDPAARWGCSACGARYGAPELADLLTEHVADGVRAGNASRDRQIRRGAPGAAACLLHAAAHGGLLNRAAALDRYRLDGPERRALKWTLRDDGDRPLPPERCREAAAVLSQTGARQPGERLMNAAEQLELPFEAPPAPVSVREAARKAPAATGPAPPDPARIRRIRPRRRRSARRIAREAAQDAPARPSWCLQVPPEATARPGGAGAQETHAIPARYRPGARHSASAVACAVSADDGR